MVERWASPGCRRVTGLRLVAAVAAFGMGCGWASGVWAQGAPPATPQQAPTPKADAPVDLTGYWVANISEDWRWRMVTPARGDYASIPIRPETKRLADAWDPAKDEAAGEQCKSYGAPALMRTPTRLRFSWVDDETLKMETDYGMQTRLFHFGRQPAASGRPTWQGVSKAEWVSGGRGGGGGAGGAPAAGPSPPRFGSMKTVTTRLRPGYLRKNGVPYSANTVLTEYWDVHRLENGDRWMVVTILVEDPTYLQLPWMTSMHFKMERDGSKWDPTPCSSRW